MSDLSKKVIQANSYARRIEQMEKIRFDTRQQGSVSYLTFFGQDILDFELLEDAQKFSKSLNDSINPTFQDIIRHYEGIINKVMK